MAGLTGAVLVMAITVFVTATLREAYKQLIITVTIFSNLLGVSGSRIGRENALHTMEISFSNGRKLQVEIYHKALDNSIKI